MLARINKDITNLKNLVKDIEVNDKIITLKIKGPNDSLYQDVYWKIRIELSKEYPYKSPSVGFITPIYHPNVDFKSGSICLNVLNDTWTPIYNLCHIVETFIPQLLLYPNPDDPLNTEAAELYIKNYDRYKLKVKSEIRKIC